MWFGEIFEWSFKFNEKLKFLPLLPMNYPFCQDFTGKKLTLLYPHKDIAAQRSEYINSIKKKQYLHILSKKYEIYS